MRKSGDPIQTPFGVVTRPGRPARNRVGERAARATNALAPRVAGFRSEPQPSSREVYARAQAERLRARAPSGQPARRTELRGRMEP